MVFKEITFVRKDLAELLVAAGGEDGVRKTLRAFYLRMASDVMIGYFFAGFDLDAIADKQAEFLLRAMGARASYAGKAPAQAHTALPPILTGHFDRRLTILAEVLRAQGLSEAAVQTWVKFEATFRDAVVG